MKVSALSFTRQIIIYMVLAVYFTSCGLFDWSDPTEIQVKSLKDAEEKLAKHTFCGDTPNNPVYITVEFDLGDLSKPDNNYLRLLEIIGNSGLYAVLMLGGAKMGGTTVFTTPPLNEAVKGMEKIMKIYIPLITTSIKADINGISPFFFYEKLFNVSASGSKISEISDYAFKSCKTLKQISVGSAKSIGREAFRDCESLRDVFSIRLEEIGDYAFFNCSTFESIGISWKLPTLGDSVFLGSTPSKFTIRIKEEHARLYGEWLAENASKFNDDGIYIVFEKY